jgi:hypothetical protein
MIKRLFLNWKTTSIGVGMIIGAAAHLINAVINKDADLATWKNDLLLIGGGISAIVAADAANTAKALAALQMQVNKNTDEVSVLKGNTPPAGTPKP